MPLLLGATSDDECWYPGCALDSIVEELDCAPSGRLATGRVGDESMLVSQTSCSLLNGEDVVALCI